jgi:nucleoside-diphosphate-sugar epimerase
MDPKTVYGKYYEEAWNKILNITKITSDLGWKPAYALDAIISEYVEFARGNLDVLSPTISEA